MKKINNRELIQKIEKLSREKMTQGKVVQLDEYRKLTSSKTEPKTILVIEDDETMRRAMARIFESDGHQVKTVADGTQLSKVLDDQPIDIIILDVGLPWINGFELAQLLKEHKELKQIPLIFISGKKTDRDIKRGFEVGADDYITKPFNIDHMKKSVETLLKIKN